MSSGREAMIAAGSHANDPGRSRILGDAPGPLSPEDLGTDRIGHFGRYWLSLADAASGIPERERFDPAAVADLLANIILVEHLGGDEFRYRLLGTGVDWFTKRPYTGLKTSEIEGHGPGNRIHSIYSQTLRTQSLVGCAMPYVGRSSICRSVKQIAAPLRAADGRDQIVSLIEFELASGVEAKLLPPTKRWVL